mmetsp:Transcript_13934/g.39828  ORF Transcript_13934/g.39828 Transcript_13934/m.39828 type:complete len:221 (+) Transcript_13934:339-1001(+)
MAAQVLVGVPRAPLALAAVASAPQRWPASLPRKPVMWLNRLMRSSVSSGHGGPQWAGQRTSPRALQGRQLRAPLRKCRRRGPRAKAHRMKTPFAFATIASTGDSAAPTVVAAAVAVDVVAAASTPSALVMWESVAAVAVQLAARTRFRWRSPASTWPQPLTASALRWRGGERRGERLIHSSPHEESGKACTLHRGGNHAVTGRTCTGCSRRCHGGPSPCS